MATDFIDKYALLNEVSEAEALESRNLVKVKQQPDWPLQEKAIHDKLETLSKAGTWELTDASLGANIVGSKWVFQAKKGCYWEHHPLQGMACCPGFLPGAKCQLL